MTRDTSDCGAQSMSSNEIRKSMLVSTHRRYLCSTTLNFAIAMRQPELMLGSRRLTLIVRKPLRCMSQIPTFEILQQGPSPRRRERFFVLAIVCPHDVRGRVTAFQPRLIANLHDTTGKVNVNVELMLKTLIRPSLRLPSAMYVLYTYIRELFGTNCDG